MEAKICRSEQILVIIDDASLYFNCAIISKIIGWIFM